MFSKSNMMLITAIALFTFFNQLSAQSGLYLTGDIDVALSSQIRNEWGPDPQSVSESDRIMWAAGVGYDMGQWRIETEYLERIAEYTGPVAHDVDRMILHAAHLDNVYSEFGDARMRHIFANLSYSFSNSSRFKPYVGFGVGVVRASLDYRVELFDADATNLGDVGLCFLTLLIFMPHCEATGETSTNSSAFSKTLAGYQAFVGVDFAGSEHVSYSVKVRRTGFSGFEEEHEWPFDGFTARYGVKVDHWSSWVVGVGIVIRRSVFDDILDEIRKCSRC